ncbi:MAG: hypothetical protein FD156_1656 [Nitrospirae bacterium]|nr:MAG: hypothetical protein FD156_1656 [Nitrospirota bacterium]
MGETKTSLNEELVEAFYFVVSDFKVGLIDDETLKERLFRIAERYERNRNRDAGEKQKGLF